MTGTIRNGWRRSHTSRITQRQDFRFRCLDQFHPRPVHSVPTDWWSEVNPVASMQKCLNLLGSSWWECSYLFVRTNCCAYVVNVTIQSRCYWIEFRTIPLFRNYFKYSFRSAVLGKRNQQVVLVNCQQPTWTVHHPSFFLTYTHYGVRLILVELGCLLLWEKGTSPNPAWDTLWLEDKEHFHANDARQVTGTCRRQVANLLLLLGPNQDITHPC